MHWVMSVSPVWSEYVPSAHRLQLVLLAVLHEPPWHALHSDDPLVLSVYDPAVHPLHWLAIERPVTS